MVGEGQKYSQAHWNWITARGTVPVRWRMVHETRAANTTRGWVLIVCRAWGGVPGLRYSAFFSLPLLHGIKQATSGFHGRRS